MFIRYLILLLVLAFPSLAFAQDDHVDEQLLVEDAAALADTGGCHIQECLRLIESNTASTATAVEQIRVMSQHEQIPAIEIILASGNRCEPNPHSGETCRMAAESLCTTVGYSELVAFRGEANGQFPNFPTLELKSITCR